MNHAPNFAFRSAMTGAFSFAGAGAAYAWVRAIETVMFPQADPRAIVLVTESGYLVRCAVAAFTGGMCAFAGWALAAAPLRAARALFVAIALAALAIGLQAGVVP